MAFAHGLQRAGHRVRIATHINFRKWVTDEGLEFYPLGGDPEQLIGFMVEHPDMLTFDPAEIKKKMDMMESIYVSTWDACTKGYNGAPYKPDVLISNPVVNVHVHLHQRLQVPLHIMFTMPWSPTNDYMHPLAPMQNLLTNYNSYYVVDQMVWTGLGGLQNDFRKKVLGLDTISSGGTLVTDLRLPQIYCMSGHLAPKPTDWGNHIDVVGFWFLDSKIVYTPPQDLVDFLEAGEPPVYIGFGSIVCPDPKKLGKDVIDAVKQSRVRALVSPGWAKIGEGMDLPPTIKLVGNVPHDWLFTKCSAVCHHGGAGTTAAGLRAGLPTIIVPFFGDQPFWGSCVAKQGVGPNPIPNRELTAANLRDAILFCRKPEVVEKARQFGDKLKKEDGVEAAIQAFHKKLPIDKDGYWVEEIHENQRYVITKWDATNLGRPEFSDVTGLLALKKDNFTLNPGWEWVDQWTPVVSTNTDPEGWRYGRVGFDAINRNEFVNADFTGSLVRTRKLVRRKKYVGHDHKKEVLTKEHLLGRGTAFTIYVHIIEGKNLVARDMSGKSDPYVQIEVKREGSKDVRSQLKRSRHVDQTLNPAWNDTLWFEVRSGDVLAVECFDRDTLRGIEVRSESMGKLEIPVDKYLKGELSGTVDLPLTGNKITGTIKFAFDHW
eukprot:TRINITY_DN1398_c1_g1_i2.p1 TRINITY_DN1398_c1_g1~~TRINITY_DN1398_c1_g1_i2.p1  ORF type:complete len:723 (+),score=207.24 TRINITY_DN1398_c1_g1_i2:200-2170(+)